MYIMELSRAKKQRDRHGNTSTLAIYRLVRHISQSWSEGLIDQALLSLLLR